MSNAACRMAALSLAAMLAGCSTAPIGDSFAQYTDRTIMISPSAGNASAANEAIQTVDPWPRSAFDPNIRGNGAQAAAAVKAYQTRSAAAASSSSTSTSSAGGSSDAGASAH